MRHRFVWPLTLAVLAGLAPVARAQTELSFGAQGLVNFANAAYSPALPQGISKSVRAVYGIGIALEVHIVGPLSVTFQPTYLQKGDKIQGSFFYDADSGRTFNGTATTTLSFFEMPLLAKAGLAFGSVTPYIMAGPAVGLTLSASEVDDIPELGSRELNVKDLISPADFSMLFGAGAEFEVSPGTAVTIDGRYSMGLRDLAKPQPGEGEHRTMKSSGVILTVGILVKL